MSSAGRRGVGGGRSAVQPCSILKGTYLVGKSLGFEAMSQVLCTPQVCLPLA